MNFKDLNRFKFSFRNALNGVSTGFVTQKNLRIHLISSLLVVIAAIVLKVSYVDWLILLLTIMLVIIAELFNTALEFTVDLFSPEFNRQAKKAKDVSAAGVLVASIFALIIGIIIFIPKVITLISLYL